MGWAGGRVGWCRTLDSLKGCTTSAPWLPTLRPPMLRPSLCRWDRRDPERGVLLPRDEARRCLRPVRTSHGSSSSIPSSPLPSLSTRLSATAQPCGRSLASTTWQHQQSEHAQPPHHHTPPRNTTNKQPRKTQKRQQTPTSAYVRATYGEWDETTHRQRRVNVPWWRHLLRQ